MISKKVGGWLLIISEFKDKLLFSTNHSPTIQAANIRALDQGISTQACLDLVSKIR
ncbi:tryptophan synthase subunit alpha [uncultured Psychrosphaera sp.]|uniref:tryptophan synthase subunit alpha n=1 Tax=uncultured Psychrosphaera sp. TaxID=1403522 RepID=UPI0026377ECF|nr:tryptophan synthase subunit alpha [uncultured Psychrosphaera sp.]